MGTLISIYSAMIWQADFGNVGLCYGPVHVYHRRSGRAHVTHRPYHGGQTETRGDW